LKRGGAGGAGGAGTGGEGTGGGGGGRRADNDLIKKRNRKLRRK